MLGTAASTRRLGAWAGPGLDAKVGYDDPTGLGSPDVANLVGQLIH